MATKKRLSASWHTTLRSRMEGISTSEALAVRLADAESSADVIKEVQDFCSQQILSSACVEQLLLLVDIAELYSAGPTHILDVYSNLELKSLSDVAERQFRVTALDDAFRAAVEQDLVRLFPSAAVLGLLRAGLVEHSDLEVQSLAVVVFQRACACGFNIGKSRMSDFFQAVDETRTVSVPIRQDCLGFLESIQRLLPLVTNVRHIQALLQAKFNSAHAIANTTDFATIVVAATGLDTDAADEIKRRAIPIARRNEQAWIDYVRSRSNVPVLAVEDAGALAAPGDGRINLHNLFGDIDYTVTDEHTSVLSASAYLVDLLELLRYAYVNPTDPKKGSLRDRLLDRRPDIAHIQLSKENSTQLVRYMDLAVEVMESVVGAELFPSTTHLPEESSLLADEEETNLSDAEESRLSQTDSINWPIYQHLKIKTAAIPLTQAPLDLAHLTIREMLLAVDCDPAKAFACFQNYKTVGSNINDSDGSAAQRLIEQSFSRRTSAEVLGLTPSDYVAITKESYLSLAMLRHYKGYKGIIDQARMEEIIKLPSVGQQWGFTDEDDSAANDKLAGKIAGVKGLEHIKSELLPRAGITFDELLQIMQTEYLARSLIIRAQTEQGRLVERLQDMRLQQAPQLYQGSAISPEVMRRLQAFIRLWTKLGWSIQDTDAAIATLNSSRLSGDGSAAVADISPETLEDIALVCQISTMTGITHARLLPLWGDMRAIGPQSLYQTIFMDAKLLAQYPGLHSERLYDDQESATLGSYQLAILAGLGITQRDLAALLLVSNMTLADKWSIDAISTIYRHQILCRILGISIETYATWREISAEIRTMAASPARTLEVLQQWSTMQNHDCEQAWVLATLSRAESSAHRTAAVSIAARLLASVDAARAPYSVLTSKTPLAHLAPLLSREWLMKCCAVVFGGANCDVVANLIDGLPIWSVNLENSFVVPAELRQAIVVSKRTMRLRQILTAEQREQLRLWTASSKTPAAAIGELVKFSVQLEQQLVLSLSALTNNPGTLTSVVYISPPPREADPEELERQILQRRRVFISALAPHLVSLSTQKAAHDIISEACPELDNQAVGVLWGQLENVMAHSASSGQPLNPSLMLADLNERLCVKSPFSGHFVATSAGKYLFKAVEAVNATIDEKPLTPNNSVTLSLAAKQCVPVTIDSDGRQGLRAIEVTSSDCCSCGLGSASVVAAEVSGEVSQILRAGQAIAALIRTFKLRPTEIECFGQLGISLHAPQWSDLLLIQRFLQLQSHIAPSCHDALARMLVKLRSEPPTDESVKSPACSELLRGILGSGIAETEQLVAQALDSLPPRQRTGSNATAWIEFLSRALDIRSVVDKTGLSLSSLAAWATLRLPHDNDADVDVAKTALASATHRAGFKAVQAVERILDQRRQALVRCVLDIEKFKSLSDADGLFEHFLIDVQMGPEQQTSRIKQAISSVQLFIHRCLSGRELMNGLDGRSVDLRRWDWMQKFTTWQANRKVFLFPENWAEPSLRDDRSEQFLAVEAAVLKTNLTKEKINEIVRQYIYSCHEVADLEIISYFWESEQSERGTYHFFARTRTAPYLYYHRELKITGVYEDFLSEKNVFRPEQSWHPWTKLDIEIPTYETEWTGEALTRVGNYILPSLYRGRLFLFVPQIVLKSRPKDNSAETKSFVNYAKKTRVCDAAPTSYWEIRMGWSERRNGAWSSKRVSASMMDVDNGALPPSIASFRFGIRSKGQGINDPVEAAKSLKEKVKLSDDDVIVIDVGYWTNPVNEQGVYHSCGSFELRKTQIVAVKPVPLDPKAISRSTLETYFGNFEVKTNDTTRDMLVDRLEKCIDSSSPGSSLTRPFMALVPGIQDKEQNLSWNMSYNETQLSGILGLVVERKTNTHLETWFCAPKRQRDGQVSNVERTSENYRRLAYSTSQALMESATNTDELAPVYSVLRRAEFTGIGDTYGLLGSGSARELSAPFSVYNWELGFHLVLLLMERLLSTQQFDLGLEVAALVFDARAVDQRPVAADKATPSSLDQCWRFAPFQQKELRKGNGARATINNLSRGTDNSPAVSNWLSNPFNAHSLARGRPSVYMKRFMTKYIELLVAKGDEYFRQDSLETLHLALQQYVDASHLFGAAPVALAGLTKPVIKTYNELEDEVNSFATAKVDLELCFPFLTDTKRTVVSAEKSRTYDGVLGVARAGYFSIPANPQHSLLRQLIDDRMFKLRNNLDIQGNPRRFALFDPPIDPAQLVRAYASGGGGAAGFAADITGPMPNYRFVYLLQKAIEMCNEVKSMADSYTAVKEKRDTEKMAMLRAGQDCARDGLVLSMKRMQREESLKAMEALQETRSAHVMRLRYYLALIGEPESCIPGPKAAWTDIAQAIGAPTKDELAMSPEEALEQQQNDKAEALQDVSENIQRSAAILTALPNFMTEVEPMGVGASFKFDAENVSRGMGLLSDAISASAGALRQEASRAARKGQMLRQLQERRLAANSAGRDIKSTDLQVEAHEIKIKMCDLEIATQQKQTEDNQETWDFLRTKYTSESLYAWLDASLRTLLYDTYVLALDLAKSAEKAFLFEQGPSGTADAADRMLSSSYWDSSHDGLLSAQNLYLGLRKIERAYQTRSFHDYELKKQVSLRQLDPWALQRFRRTGQTTFALPEYLFDLDFPGHYCRRIKSVSLTIPCVMGPYTTMACTLKLLSHCYRVQQGTGSGSSAAYYADEIESDTRYRTDNVPITSVAVSSGRQDDGQFEASFNGERYGPFEGAGAISTWSLRLPEVQQFDYKSIADVVLHVNYTSREGGAGWARAATDAVKKTQKKLSSETFYATLELNEGNTLRNPQPESGSVLMLGIENFKQSLPFWAQGAKVVVVQAWVLTEKGVLENKEVKLNGTEMSSSTSSAGTAHVLEIAAGQYNDWTGVQLAIFGLQRAALGEIAATVIVQYAIE